MDRKQLEARLAASAVKAELVIVPLSSGDKVSLRKLTNDEMVRAVTAAGNEADAEGRLFATCLRFALVDDDGNPLLRSFEESAGFINTLELEDFQALHEAFQKIPAALGEPEVMEAGKAS